MQPLPLPHSTASDFSNLACKHPCSHICPLHGMCHTVAGILQMCKAHLSRRLVMELHCRSRKVFEVLLTDIKENNKEYETRHTLFDNSIDMMTSRIIS